ncbi:MAG TPA: hypothetical protein VFE28_14195 [Candidatus Krumholzibacteria bacterium]|nr:hypothetical protein [Candidatus Krumholzibacteria bacterium]
MPTLPSRVRPLLDVVVAPPAAFAAVEARPSLGVPLLVWGGSAAALLVLQASLLAPALRLDPLFADLPANAAPSSWVLGLVMALLAPLGILLRGVALGSVLHAVATVAGGRLHWRQCLSLVLHLEAIFLLESACTVLVLGLDRPSNWEEVRAVHLRAGLDLFWQPHSAALAAAAATVNVFTLWWGALLACGLARLAALPLRLSLALVTPLWAISVALRLFLHPR